MTAPATYARNASLDDLVAILRTNHARKFDVVAPTTAIRSESGLLVIRGAEAVLTPDGVTTTEGSYRPTSVCDEGIARRLGIPPGYLATMRAKNVPLLDKNINDWLAHEDYRTKQFLIRAFRADEGGDGVGVARAFLSDSYDPSADDLDVLMAALDGVKEAGVPIDISGCSLTDRRMYVRVRCEQVAVNAGPLVENYRSPFSRQTGRDLPLAFAGFEIGNSEVGLGRFYVAPRIELQVCTNGMTRRIDAFERQHLGRKLQAGQIKWSETTQRANLELIKTKTTDSVKTFLSQAYIQKWIDEINTQAGVEVTKPEETIKIVSQQLRFTEDQQAAILSMFIRGGDMTAGGVMNAVTASAQEHPDADAASEMEAAAMRVLELAAKHA